MNAPRNTAESALVYYLSLLSEQGKMLFTAILLVTWTSTAFLTGADSADCMLGSGVEPTTALAGQLGQFLDLQHPVPCTGNITAWHYCYYTSEVTQPNTEHSVYLRVWRPVSPTSWDLVYNSRLVVTPDSRSPVFCSDIALGEDQRFVVEAGDILAVYLPALLERLPVVAEGVSLSLLHMDTRRDFVPFTSQTVQEDDLREVSSVALNVYAEVDEQPTTTLPDGEQDVVQLPSGSNGTSASGSSDGGAIAAGILVPLLVIMAVAVIVGTVLLLVYYKRRGAVVEGKNVQVEGIDNINYVGTESVEIPMQPHPAASSHTYENSRPSNPDRTAYNVYAIPKPLDSILANPKDPVASSTVTPASNGVMSGAAVFTSAEQDYTVFEDDLDQEVVVNIGSASVEYHRMLREHLEGMDSLDENDYATPPCEEDEIYRVLSRQKIPRVPADQITLRDMLGSRMGTVRWGMWKSSQGLRSVAVKLVPIGNSQEDRIKLLQEAVLMGQFQHPNVVELYGVVTDGDTLMVVMEHLRKGDLKRCLSKLRPTQDELVPDNTAKVLLSYSQQVAFAMYYLASRSYVHRDLAARNIFVSRENICKIGDFGMSRDLADENYLVTYRGKIPLKWTAPEAIHCRKYSTASDVWSYGCVLYEIWSLGQKPYKNDSNSDVIKKIDTGFRLPPPPGCPKAIYKLMMKCWHPAPMSRPSFRDILSLLLDEETRVLDIPAEDASTHPRASVLGSDLQDGEQMYMNLQQMYKHSSSNKDPDYEYAALKSSEV